MEIERINREKDKINQSVKMRPFPLFPPLHTHTHDSTPSFFLPNITTQYSSYQSTRHTADVSLMTSGHEFGSRCFAGTTALLNTREGEKEEKENKTIRESRRKKRR